MRHLLALLGFWIALHIFHRTAHSGEEIVQKLREAGL